jgi:hypothetical protein
LAAEFNEKERYRTGTDTTNRRRSPGLFVAGDASRDVQWSWVAAAEAPRRRLPINQSLIEEALL